MQQCIITGAIDHFPKRWSTNAIGGPKTGPVVVLSLLTTYYNVKPPLRLPLVKIASVKHLLPAL